ncbi:hypothetical protein D9M71_288910 [compost metagenome]
MKLKLVPRKLPRPPRSMPLRLSSLPLPLLLLPQPPPRRLLVPPLLAPSARKRKCVALSALATKTIAATVNMRSTVLRSRKKKRLRPPALLRAAPKRKAIPSVVVVDVAASPS